MNTKELELQEHASVSETSVKLAASKPTTMMSSQRRARSRRNRQKAIKLTKKMAAKKRKRVKIRKNKKMTRNALRALATKPPRTAKKIVLLTTATAPNPPPPRRAVKVKETIRHVRLRGKHRPVTSLQHPKRKAARRALKTAWTLKKRSTPTTA